MAAENRTTLKTYFETGDKPTEAQFVNLIDSCYNLTDDSTAFLGLSDTPASYSGEALKAVRVNTGATALEFYTPSVADSDNIQNAAGTTGLFTEETANRLVGHSTGTGTALIFELFEGTGTQVSVFQVDGNGNISRDGNELIGFYGSFNNATQIGIGSTTTGVSTNSVFIGRDSGLLSNGATGAIGIGYQAGLRNTGDYNISVGYLSGSATTIGAKSINIGFYAGNTNITGSNIINIGSGAGRYNLTSNMLFIDSTAGGRANAAGQLTDSLIVGLFDATPANQYLRINAPLELPHLKSGATQVGASAAANEIWYTVSHATLPDYVLMIGV